MLQSTKQNNVTLKDYLCTTHLEIACFYSRIETCSLIWKHTIWICQHQLVVTQRWQGQDFCPQKVITHCSNMRITRYPKPSLKGRKNWITFWVLVYTIIHSRVLFSLTVNHYSSSSILYLLNNYVMLKIYTFYFIHLKLCMI